MSLKPWTREEVAADLRESVLSRYGLDLTPSFIDHILDGSPELLQDCQTLHVDTSNREGFIETVSEKLGCGEWPKGASTDEDWEDFKVRLRLALDAAGQRYVEVEDRPPSP